MKEGQSDDPFGHLPRPWAIAAHLTISVPAMGIAIWTWAFWQPLGEPIEGVEAFFPIAFLDKLGPTFGNFFYGLALAAAWAIPATATLFLTYWIAGRFRG
ncbi:MAG: hypothetical protein MK101_05600 [Phycisphaerales bacterium]|nr:hypothetical protein [Phycisphaerales bacterium]